MVNWTEISNFVQKYQKQVKVVSTLKKKEKTSIVCHCCRVQDRLQGFLRFEFADYSWRCSKVEVQQRAIRCWCVSVARKCRHVSSDNHFTAVINHATLWPDGSPAGCRFVRIVIPLFYEEVLWALWIYGATDRPPTIGLLQSASRLKPLSRGSGSGTACQSSNGLIRL